MSDDDYSNEEEDKAPINIKQYDWSTAPDNLAMVVIASRRSGKSVLVRDLLWRYFIKEKKFKNIFIVSPTLHNSDYSFIDKKYKYTEFDADFVQKIFDHQTQLIKNDPDGDHKCLLILDDILKSCDSATKDLLSRIFCIGRHYSLNIVLVSQSFKFEITPIIKFNADVIAIFKTKNFNNKIEIQEQWLGFSNKDQRKAGMDLIDTIAKGYRMMIIDQSKSSDKIEEFVFHYEVDIEKSVPKDYYFY
jgi:hypothetical protein